MMNTQIKSQLSDLSLFSPRNYRFKVPYQQPNSVFQQHKMKQQKKHRDKTLSLHAKFRYQLMDLDDENNHNQHVSFGNKYLRQLKNVVARIIELKQQEISRRKSAYGELFGELTEKEMLNFPTVIEAHKTVNKSELALTSFAIMLERKQRKKTTRKLSKKLSKQESMVGIMQNNQEYDNMERPPTCKTPPRLTQRPKQKTKMQLEKEKYFKEQDVKMGHFLSGKQLCLQGTYQQNFTPFKQNFYTQSFASLPNLKRNSPAQSPVFGMQTQINLISPLKSVRQSSNSITLSARPYQKHNTQLLKKIQQICEVKTNTTIFSQKQTLVKIN